MNRIKLVICRHTQTDDNKGRKYTGQNDPPINVHGAQQADELAATFFNFERVAGIVSSDLARTRSLANRIGAQLNMHPTFTNSLREIDVGTMAGMKKEDAIRDFPDDRYRTNNPFFDFRDIGGENWEAVLERHKLVLEELVSRYGVPSNDNASLPRVILIGHGSSFRRVFVDEYRVIPSLHPQGQCQRFVWPPY